MKKRLIIFSILLSLALSLLTVVHKHEHIHAATSCPNCGSTNITLNLEQMAMCTAPGSREYYCNDCYTQFSEIIDPLGHNWGTPVVRTPATCTSTGTSLRTCIRCSTSETITTPALGHNYTSTVTKAATCTEAR